MRRCCVADSLRCAHHQWPLHDVCHCASHLRHWRGRGISGGAHIQLNKNQTVQWWPAASVCAVIAHMGDLSAPGKQGGHASLIWSLRQ